MKLKNNFETVEMDGQTMAVPTDGGADADFMVRMNETAAFIFEILKEDVSEDEIIDRILKEYSGVRAEIASFVKDFTNTLKENGMLE